MKSSIKKIKFNISLKSALKSNNNRDKNAVKISLLTANCK